MNKKAFAALASLSLLSAVSAYSNGGHVGEADKIQAQVSFLNPTGQTTTDGSGITYRVPAWGWQSHEAKVYPSSYWGTFPMYFTGETMNFSVTLANTASNGNKPFKIRVRALNNVLETSGAAGMAIGPAQEWIVDSLRPGESRTVNGSVYIAPHPSMPSGLDLTRVQILHLNEGNQDAGLIKEVIAVWCPPSVRPPGR